MAQVRNLTCKTNPVQRKRGGNAVAAAAYRAGENLYDVGNGQTHRFANRSPDIRETHLRSVEDAPDWHYDRAALWNNIEARETRKDARTGRDIVLGLAWELTPDEQREAVFEFADREFIERGHVCDIAFHKYGSSIRDQDRLYDQQSGAYISGTEKIAHWRAQENLPFLEAHQVENIDTPHVKIERMKGGDISGYKIYHPHAHVLISPRSWDSETGDWASKKDPHFNRPEVAKNLRYDWPKVQNRYLEAAGWDVQTSCTAATQGEDALPTQSETLPNRTYHMEQRDIQTTIGANTEFNRMQNTAIRQAVVDMPKTEAEAEERQHRLRAWWENFHAAMPEKYTAAKQHAAHFVRSLGGRIRHKKQEQDLREEPHTATPDNNVQHVKSDSRITSLDRGDHEPDYSP